MLFTTATLLALASAHVTLQSPTARDSTEDAEINSLTGPCGKGFNSPGSRTTVPLTGFSMKMQVADKDAKVTINGAIGDNPQTFPTNLVSRDASLEVITVPVDFSKLGAKAGDLVTIQVTEAADDGTKFACADLKIEGGSTTGSSSGSVGSTPGTGSGSTPGGTSDGTTGGSVGASGTMAGPTVTTSVKSASGTNTASINNGAMDLGMNLVAAAMPFFML